MDLTKPPPQKSNVKREILVAICGLVSTIAVSLAIAYIDVSWGVALYSIGVFFVLPAGALAIGMAAASGYYFGSVWLHQKPVGGMLLNMLIAAACAYLLIHYIPYLYLEIDGKRVADFISFWTYLDILIRETSLTFSIKNIDIGDTDTLGRGWGYAYAALQLLGFVGGGYAVYLFLSDRPFCDACSKYMKKTKSTLRYTSDTENMPQMVQSFAQLLVDNRLKDAIEYHENSMGERKVRRHHLCSSLEIYRCPSCRENRMDFVVKRAAGNDWKDIDRTKIIHSTSEELVPS